MDGYLAALGLQFIPSFDFSSYNFKDWLQLVAAGLAIAVTSYGWWKAFRYSKSQIAKRLVEYLQGQDKSFDEARRLVVNHLRNPHAADWKPGIEVHERIQNAIKPAASNQQQDAERELERFAIVLMHSADIGRRHMELAKKQAASFLVFAGLIARKREENGPARRAWTKALDYNPNDAEAVRGLAELGLKTGTGREALRKLDHAVTLAPDDKRLGAEVSLTKADFFKERGNPRLELRTLNDCAPVFEEIREYRSAGQAYERAAEIEASLGRNNQARSTLRKAYNCYYNAQDRVGAKRVRDRMIALGDDVSGLTVLRGPSRWPSIPWPWVRLSLEVLILGAACYVLFMR